VRYRFLKSKIQISSRMIEIQLKGGGVPGIGRYKKKGKTDYYYI
jgi:hypothetical protein